MSYDRDHGGGVARLVYDLAHGLLRRGHQVTVVCEDLHASGEGQKIEAGITVLRYRLPRTRGFRGRRHSDHIAAASKALDALEGAPDVVHGHSLFQYVAALRRFGSAARCCYSIHSPFVDELRITWGAQGLPGKVKARLGLPIIERLETECLTGSSALTALSDFTRTLIARRYGGEIAARVITIPGWVDLERFAPLSVQEVAEWRTRLEWVTDRPIFFVLRRLEARMGLDNLLHALNIVRTRGHQVHTYIGGSGSQLPSLLALRGKLDLNDEVTFMGFVSGERLPFAYGACDASVIPTAQLECFGIIALEALACGRPTLVTPVGALPEILQPVEPRWIAQGNSPEQIADLLCAYLAGHLPSHSGETLRQNLAVEFSFETALKAYEQVLIPATA